jgi:phage baseplate assembly protein W
MSRTLDFPWAVDGTGRTATTGRDEHVRDLIEQVLLTSPGERVMRPEFGAGLLAQVFAPGGPEAAAASQFLIQASLERELANVITIESVEVQARDAALIATIAYVVRATGSHEVQTFRTPPGVSP